MGLPTSAAICRDDGEMAFDLLHCISGVDYFEPNEKKAAVVEWQPHIELLYHLFEHDAPASAGAEGLPSALDGRSAGRTARGPEPQPAFGGRPSGTSARFSI